MLRAEPDGNNACLVALTGFAQPEDQRRALRAGFDLHLATPVQMAQLERVLANARAPSRRGRPG